MIMNEISECCRQYQYLQLENPSSVEDEIPIHKTLAMDLLERGGPTGPPGSDRVKSAAMLFFKQNSISPWSVL